MNHHDSRIVTYMERHPDVKTSYVANIFAVERAHVAKLRRIHGCLGTRKKAALDRRMTPGELDKAILDAVYKRGLVDTVLTK